MDKRRVLVYSLILLISLIDSYLISKFDSFVMEGIFVLAGAVIIFETILYLFRWKQIDFSEGVGRYSMLCKNCGWEWMSHTTEIEPKRCANCGSEKNLEVIGWRRIKDFTKKREESLKRYF